MHDHPLAVRKILSVCDAEAVGEGGAEAGGNPPAPVPLKAVIHCQGSISFMMAAVAGRLDPRVTHIVSSAVSLFIDVTESTWLKQRLAMPLVAKTFSGLDAQWGIRPSTPTAGLFAALAKRMERPCGNPTCQVANFMYGSGWDVLFRHVDDNGDPWVVDPVHEWSGREVGYTPLSLIAQVAESSRHGYIVPSPTPPPGTPPAYLATPAQDRAPRSPSWPATTTTCSAGRASTGRRGSSTRRSVAARRTSSCSRASATSTRSGPADAVEVSFPVIKAGLEWERGDPPPHQATGTADRGRSAAPAARPDLQAARVSGRSTSARIGATKQRSPARSPGAPSRSKAAAISSRRASNTGPRSGSTLTVRARKAVDVGQADGDVVIDGDGALQAHPSCVGERRLGGAAHLQLVLHQAGQGEEVALGQRLGDIHRAVGPQHPARLAQPVLAGARRARGAASA